MVSKKPTRKYGIILKMSEPITQSREWGKLQDALGEVSVYKQADSYYYLAIIKHTPAGNYLYCPYGPVAKTAAGFNQAIESLMSLAREHRAIFIRIEPQNPDFTLPKKAKKVKDLSPADTWVLDLTQDKATILTNFSQGTRTRYNTFAKKGLTVESTRDPEDIKHLVALQAKLFKSKHLTAYDANYLKKELEQPFATLYLVKYHTPDFAVSAAGNCKAPTPKDGQVLAASLFFDHQGTRYYMQSAADGEFKKLPATVALLTTALFDAKEQGIKEFDFWGIAPDGAPSDHPWQGFTEFKKSFGGSAKHYAGTYDIVLNPAKYRLFHTLKKLKKSLH